MSVLVGRRSTIRRESSAVVGGSVYFAANDGIHGYELWRSDGTADGTVMVKDIRRGSKSSHPRHLTDVGGTLYFAAKDGSHGQELWKSDGTADGTVMVKDIRPGSKSSHPRGLTDVEGTLYFTAERRYPRLGAVEERRDRFWIRHGDPARVEGPQTSRSRPHATLGDGCTSPPTTPATVRSSGRATGPLPAPSW